MAVQNIPRPHEDPSKETLVDAATAVLAGRRRDIPLDFLTELYGRAVADDLDRYSPEELAALAEQSWSFLLERKPGAPKIAFTSARSAHNLAVLEILNDDMPFLVELGARRD